MMGDNDPKHFCSFEGREMTGSEAINCSAYICGQCAPLESVCPVIMETRRQLTIKWYDSLTPEERARTDLSMADLADLLGI